MTSTHQKLGLRYERGEWSIRAGELRETIAAFDAEDPAVVHSARREEPPTAGRTATVRRAGSAPGPDSARGQGCRGQEAPGTSRERTAARSAKVGRMGRPQGE